MNDRGNRNIRLPESYLAQHPQAGSDRQAHRTRLPWPFARKKRQDAGAPHAEGGAGKADDAFAWLSEPDPEPQGGEPPREQVWASVPPAGATPARRSAEGPHKRPRRRLRRVLLAAASLALVCALGVSGYLYTATRNDFLWLDLSQLPHKDATILYAWDRGIGDWKEYARLEATQQKRWVDLAQIPVNLQHAFVAIEDRDFYRHHGVSWKRTIYAVLNEVKKTLTGTYFGGEEGIKQGASTITQQLIKNLTRDEDTSGLDGYLRKVREIWRASRLESSYSKDTILEAYLNVISFTGNTAGVEAESVKLFGKSAKDLTLAECASIAAITKNPARYDPAANADTHLARRNYILYEMYGQGYITQAEYDTASAEPLHLAGGSVTVPKTPITSYFTDKVLEDVSQELGKTYGLDRTETTNLLYNGGLRIYTTVDTALQTAMEKGMKSGGFFPQNGLGVKTTQTQYNADGTRVLDASGKAVQVPVTEYPQGAMVSVDYEGRLCAVVGGLGDKEISRGFNRGTDAVRQVGSTMKPIGAYALALQKNRINWSTPFLDAPVRQIRDDATGEMKDWPANFSKTYSQQNVLVADALAQSINTIAVRVGEKAGVGDIYRFMTGQLGITSFTSKDKAAGPMILGSSTYGVTPYELAGAYMMLGNGGSFTTLHCYESVQTGYGKQILTPKVTTRRVLDSDTAYIMNRLLAGVMQGQGTGAGYRVQDRMDSVGKTGTTSDNRDYWFVGLTPYYVTATWYGYDSGFALNTANGTHAPASAWRSVMAAGQKALADKKFPVDGSVVSAQYCTETGGLAQAGCTHKATGYYKAGHLPAPCAKHAA